MKVFFTADTVGGVWTYSLELARALAPHGIEVALATMGAPLTKQQCQETQRIPGLDVFESGFKLEWMEDPWQDVARAGAWLLEIAGRVRPDVVHLNGFAHGALPWPAPVLIAGHSCVLSWWQAVRDEAAPGSWDRYRSEVGRGLQAADIVAAPTRSMLQALERHYGPFRAARVVPNGRDAALFGPGAKEPFVLSAGRLWDEAKNVGALERVAPRLPWPLYVAGEDQHPDGGHVRHESARLLGRLSPPALAGWLARAAIYALPARYEPFGLSALEAGLAGCALVLGDIPSLREVWGEAAVFVPPDDTGALEQALTALMADAPRRESLAARARARALLYTPRQMAAGYLQAYRDLLTGVEG